MKYNFFVILFLLSHLSWSQERPVELVDPQIGSVHGRWFFYTPAALPFGMAKLAPHTNAYGSEGGWGPVGYDDRHTSIEGFGHFHEFQVGGLVMMPTTGEIKTLPGSLEDPDAGYRSRFDKATEEARPGYYQVTFKDYQIKAELTASKRAGIHRYTYPKNSKANLIIDIGHRQGESSDIISAKAEWVSDRELVGSIVTYPEYAKFCDPDKYVRMYFYVHMSQVPDSKGSFVNADLRSEANTSGTDNGLYMTFDTEKDQVVELRVGLSYTSTAAARSNLEAELTGRSFEDVREAATESWNQMLSRLQVTGGRKSDRIKFYTGLYHALLGRGLASDVSGTYPQVDGGIGQIPLDEKGQPKYIHVNTDGMWGGFWNLSQLWSLAYPKYFSDYLQSNIDLYKHRGWLHDGAATGVYTNGVQTNFQGLLLAAAYHVGIRDFDWKTGYEAAVKNEIEYRGRNLGNGKYDLSYFVKDHYVPYKDTTISNGWVFNFGGSHTLEYSFSSYAVGQWAKSLKKEADYKRLMDQAGFYKNLFDPETKFIRPRLEKGGFIKDFDPMKGWDGFQEGNAYQYTWYVPHDVGGLIELMGNSEFNRRLEEMFEEARKTMFGGDPGEVHSFSGVEKLYNHGNQPCLHNPWLFNYSGKPWLTQKWTRIICDEFYGVEPLHGYGVGQDEDQGQLGAWYVMASLGLFDVQGHSAADPTFQFGSPVFDEVTIKLDKNYYSGKELKIRTQNNAADHYYIQSVKWNGKDVSTNWIYHKELMKGGTLEFEMGKAANKNWGATEKPPSMTDELKK